LVWNIPRNDTGATAPFKHMKKIAIYSPSHRV